MIVTISRVRVLSITFCDLSEECFTLAEEEAEKQVKAKFPLSTLSPRTHPRAEPNSVCDPSSVWENQRLLNGGEIWTNSFPEQSANGTES